MKTFLLTMACLMIAVVAYAQNVQTDKKANEGKLKDHVCTAACTKGNHVYAHGEKGHVCGPECMKVTNQETGLKDHVCTAACKGQHVYVHGEKGHVCGEECKKLMSNDEELKDHVCTSACENGQHVYAHGEKGHVCTDACKKLN